MLEKQNDRNIANYTKEKERKEKNYLNHFSSSQEKSTLISTVFHSSSQLLFALLN